MAIDRSKMRKRFDGQDVSSVLSEVAGNQAGSNTSPLFKNSVHEETSKLLRLDETATVYVPHDKIYPNPLNKPYMEGLEERDFEALKLSILSNGLMHNLVALDDGKGKYRLISGEKRWTAIGRMTKEEYDEKMPNGVEVKVIPYDPSLSVIDEHIMLLTCNVLVFSSGSPDTRQLRDLIRLYRLKGFDKKELVDYLGYYLESSNNNIYKLINEANACEELQQLLTEGLVTRAAMQILGSLNENDQKTVCEQIRRDGLKVREEEAQGYKKSLKEIKKNKPGASTTGDESATGNTISFIKYEKNINVMQQALKKGAKIKTSGMTSFEKDLLRTRLELISKELNELRDNLVF